MAEDIDRVIKWARSQGWRVENDANGYRRFYAPDGHYVVRYPATPSNSYRRLRDVLTALRRNGLDWPPLSKKEQRASSNRKDDER